MSFADLEEIKEFSGSWFRGGDGGGVDGRLVCVFILVLGAILFPPFGCPLVH